MSPSPSPSPTNDATLVSPWTRLIQGSLPVLPTFRNEHLKSAVPPAEVTKVCLRLRHLVQECVPCEMEESRITTPHSRIITPQVVKAAKEAGGNEYRGCVVCYSGSRGVPVLGLTRLL